MYSNTALLPKVEIDTKVSFLQVETKDMYLTFYW